MLPKGVYFYKGHKNPYVVRPQLNGKRIFLGYFATAEEAKSVYDNFRQKEKQHISGTKAGAAKAKIKILAKDPNFFKKIGSIGGKNSNTGGFASDKVGKDGLTGKERSVVAGAAGGRISKRKPKVV